MEEHSEIPGSSRQNESGRSSSSSSDSDTDTRTNWPRCPICDREPIGDFAIHVHHCLIRSEGGNLESIRMGGEDENLPIDAHGILMNESPHYSGNNVILPNDDPVPAHVAHHKVVVGGAGKRLFTDKDKTSKTYSSKDPVVEVLKNRIRQLESKEENREVCSVCLEPYHRPAISVCCWHVHCEECWLQALGFQEICPKCGTCTCPADLRRIYL